MTGSELHPKKRLKAGRSRLSPGLDKGLRAYITAASAGLAAATGAVVLALDSPAEAKVVYTPSSIGVVSNVGQIPLDLNHDGTPDFEFSNYNYSTHGFGQFFLKVIPGQAANEVFSVQTQSGVGAAALSWFKEVGPQGNFQPDPARGIYLARIELNGSQGAVAYGSWRQVETAYLGFKFVIKGEVHYGWARVTFPQPGEFWEPTISGYAYETVANLPTITGQSNQAVAGSDSAAPTQRQRSSAKGASLGGLAAGVRAAPTGPN